MLFSTAVQQARHSHLQPALLLVPQRARVVAAVVEHFGDGGVRKHLLEWVQGCLLLGVEGQHIHQVGRTSEGCVG